jgi:protein-S-isoprenylcysteine O-methyltransferase Ste14
MGLFNSLIDEYLFWITYSIWVSVEFVGTFLVPWLRGRIRRGDPSFYAVFLGLFLSIALSFLWAYSAIYVEELGFTVLPNWCLYVGSITMLIGLALRQWAIATLGRYFSPMVTVESDQRVVERGPYRYIRHPAYLGALLELIGLPLMLRNWLALLATLLIYAPTYGYRMMREEDELRRKLGNAYVDYARRVRWRLIPLLI